MKSLPTWGRSRGSRSRRPQRPTATACRLCSSGPPLSFSARSAPAPAAAAAAAA
eukprot:CAMPEP_0171923658 /NCGR_PEP_ID=MMETSP0993-20121228/22337_1 /TAXON_ID=483369 /ORGANISM="non described non described, Strain CCMP2098" /LENGTH=53 /DNA_ID=CAMNT_0012561729 /DNA_START=259 /DNA_END=418 /DNA_ORIENTATION=+